MNSLKQKASVLSKDTLVPASLLEGLATIVGGGAVWMTKIDMRLENIEDALVNGTSDRWKGAHMKAWVHAFDDAVEVWTLQVERSLSVEGLPRFQAPEPDTIRGLGGH